MGPVRAVAVAAVLVGALFQAGAVSAHPNGVQIVRGGQPASIVETREASVRVFRGAPAAKLAVLDGNAVAPRPIVKTVSSGSNIWFVDRVAGKLSVCRLAATTQVGERRIDCYARDLSN